MKHFIDSLVKTELHVHIEGTLEPELLFALAKRNNITIPYKAVEELKALYQFKNLQSFLNLYYQGMAVLKTEQDFYDLTYAYLEKAISQGVQHAEIFFDPQAHLNRGIAFDAVINGIDAALKEGEKTLKISSGLILCFLRDLPEEDAFKTFELALPHLDKLIAVGLDSAEIGHPPEKFKRVFAKARAEGLLTVAHAGEEGPAEYIWSALLNCHVSRIDHGVKAITDPDLIDYLVEKQIPLTICPFSNIQLRVYDNMKQHPIKALLDRGVCVTINSDDPAYFKGYISENYQAVASAFDLTKAELTQIAKNSIVGSFASKERKRELLTQLPT